MYDGKQQYKRYLPSCSLLLTNDNNFITLEPESQKVTPVKLLLFRTSYSTYSEESPPGTFTPTVGNSNQKNVVVKTQLINNFVDQQEKINCHQQSICNYTANRIVMSSFFVSPYESESPSRDKYVEDVLQTMLCEQGDHAYCVFSQTYMAVSSTSSLSSIALLFFISLSSSC